MSHSSDKPLRVLFGRHRGYQFRIMSLDKTFIALLHLFTAVPNLQKVYNAKVVNSFSVNRPYLISTDLELIFVSVKAPVTLVDHGVFTNALLD